MVFVNFESFDEDTTCFSCFFANLVQKRCNTIRFHVHFSIFVKKPLVCIHCFQIRLERNEQSCVLMKFENVDEETTAFYIVFANVVGKQRNALGFYELLRISLKKPYVFITLCRFGWEALPNYVFHTLLNTLMKPLSNL